MKPRYYLLTALYCAGIFWLSSLSEPPQPSFTFPGIDKLAHAVLYAGLCAIVSMGIRRSNPTPLSWKLVAIPVLFSVFYGITDEIHQVFVPHRTFDWWDLMADTLGAAVAQSILCARAQKRNG